MNTNIRGLPAETLLKSNVFPILEGLARLTGNSEEIMKEVDDAHNVKYFVLLFGSLCAGLAQLVFCLTQILSPWPLAPFAAHLLFVVFLAAALNGGFKYTIWFASRVRELDCRLRRNGLGGGITHPFLQTRRLPDTAKGLIQEAIFELVKLERRARDVERGKVKDDLEILNKKAEEIRRDYRALAAWLATYFGTDVGPFDPMFAEADRRLNGRPESKKAKALTAAP